MRPFVYDEISVADQALLSKVKTLMRELPNDCARSSAGGFAQLSCHHVSRACAAVFGLEFVDGSFLRGFDHSWLQTPAGTIIDPYPPLLLSEPVAIPKRSQALSPWARIYLPGPVAHLENELFQEEVKAVIKAAEEIAVKLRLTLPPYQKFLAEKQWLSEQIAIELLRGGATQPQLWPRLTDRLGVTLVYAGSLDRMLAELKTAELIEFLPTSPFATLDLTNTGRSLAQETCARLQSVSHLLQEREPEKADFLRRCHFIG